MLRIAGRNLTVHRILSPHPSAMAVAPAPAATIPGAVNLDRVENMAAETIAVQIIAMATGTTSSSSPVLHF